MNSNSIINYHSDFDDDNHDGENADNMTNQA